MKKYKEKEKRRNKIQKAKKTTKERFMEPLSNLDIKNNTIIESIKEITER